MNAEAVTVAHAMPGRVRLKVTGVRNNPALATALQQRLATVPAVQSVEVNVGTGSVIIRYDTATFATDDSFRALAASLTSVFPDLDLSHLDLSALLSTNGTAAATAPVVASSLRTFFAQVNDNIGTATGGTADLKTLVPLLLFGLGVRSLFTTDKPLVPTWYDFFWFALGTYFMLNPKPGEKPQ